jgi:hypothetical protein
MNPNPTSNYPSPIIRKQNYSKSDSDFSQLSESDIRIRKSFNYSKIIRLFAKFWKKNSSENKFFKKLHKKQSKIKK